MAKGLVITAIGVVSSVLGIITFFGPKNVHDVAKPSTPTRSATAAPAPVTDPGEGKWDYIHAADRACYAATGKVGTAGNYSKKQPGVWPAAIGKLRAEMVAQWKKVGEPDDPSDPAFDDETKKVWADYRDANWWWTQMTGELRRGLYDDAHDSYEKFKIYDDSAIKGATKLGFETCNYAWPRFTAW